MHNLMLIEECYQRFTKNLNFLLPEGIFLINLELLYHFDLLHFQPHIAHHKKTNLTQYFHIVETPEKLTLINSEFIIWIIPDHLDQIPVTYTLIAINHEERDPQLEAAFIASGVYNNSNLVLKVLEQFLIEIQDTEGVLLQLSATA